MKFSQAFASGFMVAGLGCAFWYALGVKLSLLGTLGLWSMPLGVLAGASIYLLSLWLTNLFWMRPAAMQRLLEDLHEMFKDFSWFSIVAISLLAGIGEELLFRGVLQNTLVTYLGSWLGILLASLVFGLMHYMSKTYVLITFLLGAVFGLFYHLTDSLMLMMTAHAVYDVFAFAVIVKYPHLLKIDVTKAESASLPIR